MYDLSTPRCQFNILSSCITTKNFIGPPITRATTKSIRKMVQTESVLYSTTVHRCGYSNKLLREAKNEFYIHTFQNVLNQILNRNRALLDNYKQVFILTLHQYVSGVQNEEINHGTSLSLNKAQPSQSGFMSHQ